MIDPKSLSNEQLDAWVAEHAMGWRKDPAHPKLRVDGWWQDKSGSFFCEIPEFSTDPAASKQLRSAMRAKGFGYQSWDESPLSSNKVTALFWAEDDSWSAMADSEERARSEAAYLALEARK